MADAWKPTFIEPPSKLKKEAVDFMAECTTEDFLMCEDIFGLTQASPLQRAICRVVDGIDIGDLWDDAEVRDAFGNARPDPSLGLPKEIIIVAGIRGGKTLLSAAIVVKKSIFGDLEGLRDGEVARSGICAPQLPLAAAAYEYIEQAFQASPVLREVRLVEPPKRQGETFNRLCVYNPIYNKRVDVMMFAARRGGASGVSRWQAAFVVDEAARMLPDLDEGVINYEEVRKAVIHRIRPGGVFMAITSPYDPIGPIYDAAKKVSKPTRHLRVIHAPAWAMNPNYWTPERVAEAKESDALTYETDVAANFVSHDHQFFDNSEIDGSLRTTVDDFPYVPGARYVAAIDGAARKNTFTLAIGTNVLGVRTVVLYREWTGTIHAPLDLANVMKEVCKLCIKYDCVVIKSDFWSFDALNALAVMNGCYLFGEQQSANERTKQFMNIKHLMSLQSVSLPGVAVLRQDFISIRRRMSRNGPVVDYPTTGSRHADGAVACAKVIASLTNDSYAPPIQEDEGARRIREQKEMFSLKDGRSSEEAFLKEFDEKVESELREGELSWLEGIVT